MGWPWGRPRPCGSQSEPQRAATPAGGKPEISFTFLSLFFTDFLYKARFFVLQFLQFGFCYLFSRGVFSMFLCLQYCCVLVVKSQCFMRFRFNSFGKATSQMERGTSIRRCIRMNYPPFYVSSHQQLLPRSIISLGVAKWQYSNYVISSFINWNTFRKRKFLSPLFG